MCAGPAPVLRAAEHKVGNNTSLGKQRGRATSLPNGTQIRQADIVRLLGSLLVHWFARSVERGGRIRICYTSIDGSLGHKVIPPTAIKRPPNECLCTAVKRVFVVRRERETVRSRWLSDLLARVARHDNEAPRRGRALCEPRDWLPTAVSADVAAVKIISPASSFTLSLQQPVSHEEDCSPPQTLHQKEALFSFVSFVIGPLLSKRCSGPSLMKAFALHGIHDDVGGDALREAKENQNTRARKMPEQK